MHQFNMSVFFGGTQVNKDSIAQKEYRHCFWSKSGTIVNNNFDQNKQHNMDRRTQKKFDKPGLSCLLLDDVFNQSRIVRNWTLFPQRSTISKIISLIRRGFTNAWTSYVFNRKTNA